MRGRGPGRSAGRGGAEARSPEAGPVPRGPRSTPACPPAVGSVLSGYGWYLLLAAVAVYLLVQKVSRGLAARPGGRPGAAEAAEGECGAVSVPAGPALAEAARSARGREVVTAQGSRCEGFDGSGARGHF